MDAEWLRKLCLTFPGTTEQIQWGCDLLFKVGGKMFAITPLEPAPVCLSFKASTGKVRGADGAAKHYSGAVPGASAVGGAANPRRGGAGRVGWAAARIL